MARNRTISPDFWTNEAVIDCPPMTRLLFIGLQNFADDFGVQPLRPRTIRMQVFPGDDVSNEAVRAMIDELAAQGLVRIYSVEGVEYLAIVGWEQLQRVGKRARRRYPAFASAVPGVGEAGEEAARTIANHSNVASGICEASEEPSRTIANHSNVPGGGEAGDAPSQTIANHSNVETPQSPASALRAPSPSGPSAARDLRGETEEEWRAAIGDRLRQTWPDGPPIEAMEPAETVRLIGQWIEDGCDLERDVLPAVSALHTLSPYRQPPAGLHELAVAVEVNRVRRLAPAAAPVQPMPVAA